MTVCRNTVLQVAMSVPLRTHFDYLWSESLPAGMRVLVSFGRRRLVGVVVSCEPPAVARKLKAIEAVLDDSPVFDPSLFSLLEWGAQYYHHPIGEVMIGALPVLLRSSSSVTEPRGELQYRGIVDENAEGLLGRSPAQAKVYAFLQGKNWVLVDRLKAEFKNYRGAIKGLEEKGLVESRSSFLGLDQEVVQQPMTLNDEQQVAADFICDYLDEFQSILLQGITGSGKTEVYLAAARAAIAAGRQVLFLVPEISLTPQLVSRVRDQLGGLVCTLHSGMTDRARYETWWLARQGLAQVVLGTRSAIFTGFKDLGLIVVDEEHDLSYKQQDGFRYHARDLAIKRGSLEDIPVVLGSATPSLESLQNVTAGRHQLQVLSQRIGAAKLPTISPVDLNVHAPENGLSLPLIQAIGACLDRGEQVIVYINRRGYAPVVHCYNCQWQAVCGRCDARMTYHRKFDQLRCHHCGFTQPKEENCPECETPLFFGGAGTQRVEQALLGKFPQARICRLDRDEANTANKLYRKLEAIRDGEVDLIIGTQLITKGHDFSRVSLVCVVNADQGLFSADFRGPELMFQQMLQVAGRAGRASDDGVVLIQTNHPHDPYIRMIQAHDYPAFAERCLAERKQATYPPYSRFALFRAESLQQPEALRFLQTVRQLGDDVLHQGGFDRVEILSPVTSPMEKLAGRFRAQLLVRSQDRGQLHGLLGVWLPLIEQSKEARKIRWSLDVDPMDMG